MAAEWNVKTLLTDSGDLITDVVWFVTDTVGEYTGSEGGVFTPDDSHPLRGKTYDQFNEEQIIAQVKASLGGEEVARIERQAARNRVKQRTPLDNIRINNRRVV